MHVIRVDPTYNLRGMGDTTAWALLGLTFALVVFVIGFKLLV